MALSRETSDESLPNDLVACSKPRSLIVTDKASMHTLSMLCASSKTIMDSDSSSLLTIFATLGSSMYW